MGLKLKECKGVIDALVDDNFPPEERKAFIFTKIQEIKDKIKNLKKIQGILQEHIDNDCAYNNENMIQFLKKKDE